MKKQSRALKTAATVGMSLAMVLSAAGPTINVAAASSSCNLTRKSYDALLEKLEDAGYDIDSLKLDEKISAEVVVEEAGPNDENGNPTTVTKKVKKEITIKEFLELPETIALLKEYDECTYPEDKAAVKLKNMLTGTETAEAQIVKLVEKMISEDDDVDLKGYFESYKSSAKNGDWVNGLPAKNSAVYKEAKSMLDKLSDEDEAVQMYLGNLNDAFEDAFSQYIDSLETVVDDYLYDNYDSTAKNYITALKSVSIAGDTIKDILSGDHSLTYTDAKTFAKALDQIKTDKHTSLKGAYKYEDFEDEDAVMEIIDELDAIQADLEETAELLTSSDSKTLMKDYAKLKSTIAKLAKATKNEDDFYEVLADVKAADIVTVTEYVDEIYAKFYTAEVKERRNEYRASMQDTDLAAFVGSKLQHDTNLETLMTTLVDRDDKVTYYDVFAVRTTGIKEAIKKITTDLEGITLQNLNGTNVQKVIDAEDALYLLTAKAKDGGYAESLTKDQAKTVKTAQRSVELLIKKMYSDGITPSKGGWIDKGNGDWEYLAENGSKPTKWVAAGSNWYYVKDGKMLRNAWIASDSKGSKWYKVGDNGAMLTNTTDRDGNVFNSYGVWIH